MAKVTKGRIISKARYIGSLLPRSQFVVAPQIGGRLATLKVRIGDRVVPKQLLATLENNEVIHEVEQALAAVRVAQAQYDEQNARLVNARAEYRRDLALAKKKLTAPAQREKTESSYKVEAAKLRVMLAQLAQKRSQLKAARLKLSYTQIYAQWVPRPLSAPQKRELMEGKETLEPAPTKVPPKPNEKDGKTDDKDKGGKNGKTGSEKRGDDKSPQPKTPTAPNNNHEPFRVVGERFADEGSLVQPNAKLLTLIDIRSVIAVIYATEKDYIQLKVGQVATARTYVYSKRQFIGRVARIAPLIKESSRLARVELEFPNLDLALKPGMFVRIEIDLESVDNATLIPRPALVRYQEKDGVFLYDPAKKTVRFVPIKVGIQEGGFVQVLAPALSGEVVTMGYHLLRDGSSVTVGGDKQGGSKGKGNRKGNGKRTRAPQP